MDISNFLFEFQHEDQREDTMNIKQFFAGLPNEKRQSYLQHLLTDVPSPSSAPNPVSEATVSQIILVYFRVPNIYNFLQGDDIDTYLVHIHLFISENNIKFLHRSTERTLRVPLSHSSLRFLLQIRQVRLKM